MVRGSTSAPRRVLDPRRLEALKASGLASDQIFGGLDQLTRMACRMLTVPIALVSLVESDRQWFASLVGLPEPWASARQTPLTHSFCQYVVDADAPLVITDAREHATLRDNLAIPDLGVVAYAGSPLRLRDGTGIGTFCVADTTPREWSVPEVQAVADFASIAATEIAAHTMTSAAERERRQALEAKAFLTALLDSLDVGVAACDEQGRLVLFNHALRRLLDADADPRLPASDWAGRFNVRKLDGRPLPAAEMPLLRALAGQPARDVEHIIGRDSRVVTHAHPIVGPDGVRLGAVAASHDVTEQRRAEHYRDAELAVHRALSATSEPSVAGAAVLRAMAQTLQCVHGELWLDVQLTDAVLRPVATWTDPGHPGRVPVPAALGCGAGLAGTTCRTGAPVWAPDTAADPWPMSARTIATARFGAALAVPVHGGDHAVGALCVFTAEPRPRDDECVELMNRVAAYLGEFLQRQRANELAVQLARTKDEYVALVGHELRTPLTSIASYTELIRDSPDSTTLGEVRELLDVVHRNSVQLRGIVDDLLDLAALDSGQATLHMDAVELAGVVQHAVEAVRPYAERQHVTLHVSVPDRLAVTGVEQRLRQVVDNLLSNAVKYSPHGGDVGVTLSAADAAAELTVSDQGIGIPEEEREDVFRRFFRSSRAREHGIAGTGLGLALCRIVTELHGGTIGLVGSGGPGTTVLVRLPRS